MRVMHFVTGGFSGATQVAVDLCLAARSAGMDVVLVLLRKRRTTLPAKVEALRAQVLDVRVVPGWAHAATVWALRALALEWRPDILVAHGYSEHLWDRYAGLLRALRRDWRSQFGADLPLLVVQLPNYGTPPTKPGESDWASMRAAQRAVAAEDPRTGLVVAIDLGDRYDIHPSNKQELGRRLADEEGMDPEPQPAQAKVPQVQKSRKGSLRKHR